MLNIGMMAAKTRVITTLHRGHRQKERDRHADISSQCYVFGNVAYVSCLSSGPSSYRPSAAWLFGWDQIVLFRPVAIVKYLSLLANTGNFCQI